MSRRNIADFSKFLNQRTYVDIFDRLKMLAISVFEWENLPETCSAKFLEKTLFNDGIAIFCKHKLNEGIINLRCTPFSEKTIYDEHTKYTAFSNEYFENYNINECVIVNNNYLTKPTFETIDLYSYKISEIERIIDVNINAQKTPILIKCDEKQRLTLQNLYRQYDGNTPVIYGSQSLLTDDNFKVLTTKSEYLAKNLYEMRAQYWNDALNYLGINSNPAPDKRERLLQDEINSNNEAIALSFDSFYTSRKTAAERLNKMFGLNVVVKKRENKEKEIDEKWQNIQ